MVDDPEEYKWSSHRDYDIANYSTVSSAIVRAQKAIRENETVCRDYGEIENIPHKSQGKT
jgi:hypothetical protein